jgi:thiamine biosynthesis lipoprotein
MRWLPILLPLLAILSPLWAEEPQRFEFEEPHMGTKFRLIFYASDKETAGKAAKATFARVAQLNQIMSDYSPTSELMELCKKSEQKPAGPIQVSDDLFYVLQKAQEVSQLSDGAFDVTISPIVRLWRQARKDHRLPDPDVLKEAMKRVGYKNLVLDTKARTVDLRVPGMLLDLGGIAKGYAADEGLKVLERQGVKSALVAASGDIAVSEAPPGKPGWKIDIAPLPRSKERRQLLLIHAAVSTSGDSQQYVEINGTRYSHVVNPKTGLGLTGRRSVTVVARHGIQADSMTKMASILDAKKAVSAIEQIEGAATYIVVQPEGGGEEEIHKSKGFAQRLGK